MKCCVNNPLPLCNVGTCDDDFINTGIVALSSGVYSLFLSYLSAELRINIIVNSGDVLRFPAKHLNESYEYSGYITSPDGEFLSILENLVYYDGIRFKTVVKKQLGLTVSEDNTPISNTDNNADSLQIFEAGESVSSGKAVIIDNNLVYVYDVMNEQHAGRLFGVAKTSANVGEEITIQTAGIITNVAYSFSIDKPVFVQFAGLLSTAVPTSVLLLQSIGAAVDIDTLSISIDKPIKRLL